MKTEIAVYRELYIFYLFMCVFYRVEMNLTPDKNVAKQCIRPTGIECKIVNHDKFWYAKRNMIITKTSTSLNHFESIYTFISSYFQRDIYALKKIGKDSILNGIFIRVHGVARFTESPRST